MKVLHYLFGLPPVRTGGLPKYAIDLIHGEQSLGIEVLMLIPGPISIRNRKDVKIKYWKKWRNISCHRIINPLFIPNEYGIQDIEEFLRPTPIVSYINWLQKVDVDVIHLHSIMGLHAEFIEAANRLNIPLIFTTHDFFGLCPKIDLLKNGAICNGLDWNECFQCCKNAYSVKRLWLEQTDLYRLYISSRFLTSLIHCGKLTSLNRYSKLPHTKDTVNSAEFIDYSRLKDYYYSMLQQITCFHYNSYQTQTVYETILGKKTGTVIPLSNSTVKDKRRTREYGQILRLGFIGSLTPLKGYDLLIEVLEKIYGNGNKNFLLNIYSIAENAHHDFIRWHKPYNSEEMEKVFNDMDVLVVPSICNETYGMVVLEALSYGVPILLSERVGSRFLMNEYPGTGIIFNPEHDELYNLIMKIYRDRQILVKMNQSIIHCDLNLSYMDHVKSIINLYCHICQKDNHENI